MTELSSSSFRWSMDDTGFWLQLNTQERPALQFLEGVKPYKAYDITITEHRKRRSLDANAYFWVLAGKLGAVLGISPDELYRHYIPDVADNYVVVPVRNDMLLKWGKTWCDGHAGRITSSIGPCRTVKGYTNVRCFFGSSDYDSAQMARLINLIVADCKDQGVETMPPDELDRMKGLWGNG